MWGTSSRATAGNIAAIVAERGGALAIAGCGARGVAPAVAEGRDAAAVGRGRADRVAPAVVVSSLLRGCRRAGERERQYSGGKYFGHSVASPVSSATRIAVAIVGGLRRVFIVILSSIALVAQISPLT